MQNTCILLTDMYKTYVANTDSWEELDFGPDSSHDVIIRLNISLKFAMLVRQKYESFCGTLIHVSWNNWMIRTSCRWAN